MMNCEKTGQMSLKVAFTALSTHYSGSHRALNLKFLYSVTQICLDLLLVARVKKAEIPTQQKSNIALNSNGTYQLYH